MKRKLLLTVTPLVMMISTLTGCKSTNEYIVKFDTDGGTTIEDVKVKQGEKVARPKTDPTKDGYTFDDWYTTKVGGDKFNFDSSINENITIYAHYNVVPPKEFTVTFDSKGGTSVDKATVKAGEKVSKPSPDPTKDKFSFGGWYTTSECTGTAYDFNTPVTSSFTLYAKWDEILLEKIEVSLKVTKNYYVDDEITKDDIKVTATYSDHSTKEISDWSCDDFDEYGSYYFENEGEKILTIQSGDKSAQLKITVGVEQTPYWSQYLKIVGNSLTSISVSKKDSPTFPASNEIKIPRYVRGKYIESSGGIEFKQDTRYVVNDIAEQAFSKCDNITNIILPVSILSIGDKAFEETGITNLNIPSATTFIGASIFNNCESIKTVVFEDTTNYWFDEQTYLNWQATQDAEINCALVNLQNGSRKNEVIIKDASTYLEVGKTVTMSVDIAEGESVTWYSSDTKVATVNNGDVAGMSKGLVYIKVTISSDGQPDKYGYAALYVYSDEPEYVENMEFTLISGTNNVSVKAKSGKKITGALTIPSEVDGKYVTGGTEGNTYKVTEIPIGGFSNQEDITSIVIPYSITCIGNGAFSVASGKSKLTSLTLNEGLVEIKRYAFQNSNISALKVPSTVKNLDGFSDCSQLSDVSLNEGLEKIVGDAFRGCPIVDITLPNSLKEIGTYAFDNTKIKNINIPSNVQRMGFSAFGGTSSALTCVTFDDLSTDWTITDDSKTPSRSFWTPSSDGSVNASKFKESNDQLFVKNTINKINLSSCYVGKDIHYNYVEKKEMINYGSRYSANIKIDAGSYPTMYSSDAKFYVEAVYGESERISLGYKDLTKEINVVKISKNGKELYEDYGFYVHTADKYISFNTGFSQDDVFTIEFQYLSDEEDYGGISVWLW